MFTYTVVEVGAERNDLVCLPVSYNRDDRCDQTHLDVIDERHGVKHAVEGRHQFNGVEGRCC